VLTVQTDTGHSQQQTTEASTTQTAKLLLITCNIQAMLLPYHTTSTYTVHTAERQGSSTALQIQPACSSLSQMRPACWHAHSTAALSPLLPAQTELMHTAILTAVFISPCNSLTLFNSKLSYHLTHLPMLATPAQDQKRESSRALQEAH
jgi:hypothetical protein